jgi:hypothetical protein
MGDIGLDSTLLERIYPELKPGPASSPVEAEVQELKQKAKPQSPEPLFGGSRTGTSSAGITQSRTDDTEMAWLQAPGGGAKSDTTNKSKGLGVTITGHGTSGQRTANTIASSLEGYNSKNPDKKLGLSYEDGKFTVGNSSHLSKQDLTSLISQHQYDGWHPIIEGKNKEGNWQIGLSPIGPKVESLPRNNSSRPVDRSEATDKDTGKATNKSRRNGQTNYIADKDPDDINTKHQKTGKELAEQVKPLDSKIPYNAEQLTTAPDSEVDITANQRFIDSNRKSEVNSKSPASTLNYNADIGGQETMES